MSANADITMNKSRLLRAYGAPTIADCIRNPGEKPYLLIQSSLSDIHEFAHASMAHSWLPSRTFIVR